MITYSSKMNLYLIQNLTFFITYKKELATGSLCVILNLKYSYLWNTLYFLWLPEASVSGCGRESQSKDGSSRYNVGSPTMTCLDMTANAGLHSIDKGVHIVVGLAVVLILTEIGLCVHVVRQRHVMLLPKLVILRYVLRDLKLPCPRVIGKGPWRLKGPVFVSSSDITPLQAPDRGLVSNPVGKAKLLSSWFDCKLSRMAVELPSTCHPRPGFCKFAFRSGEVLRLLRDLDGSAC